MVNLSVLGQIPDYDEPVVLHATNPTVEQFCNRLHKGELADSVSSNIRSIREHRYYAALQIRVGLGLVGSTSAPKGGQRPRPC